MFWLHSSLEEEEDWKIGTADAGSCELDGYGECLCPDARLHRCKNNECEGRGLYHSLCVGALQHRFLALHEQKGLPPEFLEVINKIEGKCPCHWLPAVIRWSEDTGETFPEADIPSAVESEDEQAQEGEIDLNQVPYNPHQEIKPEKSEVTPSLIPLKIPEDDKDCASVKVTSDKDVRVNSEKEPGNSIDLTIESDLNISAVSTADLSREEARSGDANLSANTTILSQEGETRYHNLQKGPSRPLEGDRRAALTTAICKHLSDLAPLLLEFMQDRDLNKFEGPSRTALFVLNKELFDAAVRAEKSFSPNQTIEVSWESVVRRVTSLRKEAQDQLAKEVSYQQVFDKTTLEEVKLEADFEKRRRNLADRREQAFSDVERQKKIRKIEPLVSFSCAVCSEPFDRVIDTGVSSLCGSCAASAVAMFDVL